jgi:hypothetical protein
MALPIEGVQHSEKVMDKLEIFVYKDMRAEIYDVREDFRDLFLQSKEAQS